MSDGFIPPHGGYKKLLSYQKAEIVYDATVHFCDRFIDKRSRRWWPDDGGAPASWSATLGVARASRLPRLSRSC